MAYMVVIYKKPADVAAFDKHYNEVHVPLAHKLPGLLKYEVSAGAVLLPIKGDEVHLVGVLHWESMDAMKAAFATPEGKACAADRRVLAPNDADAQMFLFDTREV